MPAHRRTVRTPTAPPLMQQPETPQKLVKIDRALARCEHTMPLSHFEYPNHRRWIKRLRSRILGMPFAARRLTSAAFCAASGLSWTEKRLRAPERKWRAMAGVGGPEPLEILTTPPGLFCEL